jgi:hypothetical protein
MKNKRKTDVKLPIKKKHNITNWFIVNEGDYFRIRRKFHDDMDRVRYERYPLIAYSAIQNDLIEVQAFVDRLNGQNDESNADRYKEAGIDENLLLSYRQKVIAPRFQSIKDQQTAFHYLKTYGIDFFLVELRMTSHTLWPNGTAAWKQSLLAGVNGHNDLSESKNSGIRKPLCRKVILQIVYELNSFLRFLNQTIPESFELVELHPFRRGDSDLKVHEESRKSLRTPRRA